MATIKVVLRRRNIKGKNYPVIIRVCHQNSTSERKIPNISVPQKYWDKDTFRVRSLRRSDPFYNRSLIINSLINSRVSEVNKRIDQLLLEGRKFKAKDAFTKAKKLDEKKATSISFADYMQEYIDVNPDQLSSDTLTYYRTTLMNWKDCLGNLKLNNVEEGDIIKFREYLTSKELAVNTIYNRMKTVRKMIRRAMRLKMISEDPFANVRLKTEKGEREYLTMEEIAKLEATEAKNDREQLAKDLFLFSCYTGLRIGDICWLKQENLKEEGNKIRLKIQIRKTKEQLSFKLPNKAAEIVKKYRVKGNAFAFPVLEGKPLHKEKDIVAAISSWNAILNKNIKYVVKHAKIEKHISFHCGRHSFAVNSLCMGADIYTLSKLLGHASVKTTEIYARIADSQKNKLIELWN